jgi:uncharacterized protein (DUF4415 family)
MPFDPENPPLTREEFARMKPFPGDLPTPLADAIRRNYDEAQARRGRGKQVKPTKAVITIRLAPETAAAWRATGKGWQTRLSAAIATIPVRKGEATRRPDRDRPRSRRSARASRASGRSARR